ncbi:uncharacterized protein PHACADRAFT_265032 [Phanerochaete carnosa HHB-10118-sp]|uniref:Fungal lipase-type domain-containing protein n=1 Tax=Phanerochaete carnosa (strain HHB-10118-sp) TaxID=650164 RepID=K5VSH1_PHACS|nr:uncharacterized protein PHACADRAFT_265032 [Phanerochaete carnosa HHB-10118-sp]EKM49514.1 hypothetical protein PHACADRAFT_265032 [Phanerochaete carnosa HHB-10118-sp]
MKLLSLISCVAFVLGVVQAVVVPTPSDKALGVPHVEVARAGVTTLSTTQLNALAPYTEFARAAYCDSSIINGWQCGQACQALPGFEATLTGGDGNDIQLYYVGYWPSQNSVVVAHQGTDPTQFLSDLTDVDILMANLDPTLFPGISTSIMAHQGFLDEHAQTAATILAETKSLIAAKGATQVILVGHSLGGALAELDSLFMAMNLPSSIHIKGVTYGTPRVGNPDYATFFDSTVPDFERINNELDPIPIVPGRFLGFSHVHGEIHIVSPGDAVSCPGDDDATDAQCTISSVPNIAESNILDHLGPYQGIFIGTIFCT